MREKIKMYYKKNKKKLYTSFYMSILLMGIVMTFIGTYKPICGPTENDTRMAIGAFCVAVWFILLPTIDWETKDKLVGAIIRHCIAVLLVMAIAFWEIEYFSHNITKGNIMGDIVFCILGVFIITYLLYVFMGFAKTLFYLLGKINTFIFPKVQQETSGLINLVKSITTAMLTITTFGASIVSFVTLLKKMADLFK